ncbi:hypothetical protein FAM6012_00070 [Lacticaseibacillus paracasei]|uniref:LtrC-like protein n=1 Tax=Lacticaseibacillus paracasei TaxID=1597 RepID=A0A8B3GX77_LACPA|nr:hypothetical protein [Lacticaseibacillus paracasei]RNE34248.1 hypothetical protein FAM6012_00070 [Lacticaseibacillus paracasei]
MPNKADVKAWKAQLVAQAEQQILKLTDSDQFKKYLNTLAKFHHYSARNIDLIYAQNPQATQVAGFKQWQKAFNRTVNRGAIPHQKKRKRSYHQLRAIVIFSSSCHLLSNLVLF